MFLRMQANYSLVYIGDQNNNEIIGSPTLAEAKAINTSYLTDSCIGFTLKMESVTKSTIFGLKIMVKRGVEKNILKSLHAGG